MSILVPASMISTMATTLGSYIQELRENLGWTQDDLGEKIGRPKFWISGIEIGRKKNLPEPHELRQIAIALGVSVTELLAAAGYIDAEAEDEKSPADSVVEELMPLIRQVQWNDFYRKLARSLLLDFLQNDRVRSEPTIVTATDSTE